MFRRKKKSDPTSEAESVSTDEPTLSLPGTDGPQLSKPESAPIASTPAVPPAPQPTLTPRSEGPRRMPEYPTPSAAAMPAVSGTTQSPRRVAIPNMPMLGGAKPENAEGKRLTVGKDISLSGEINSCDILAVEGKVEATLVGGRAIEIADGGYFKGNAEIDTADIAGRYEGDIVVRDRLTVRATGRIVGKVRYRRLEVELGGELVGDIATLDA
ncbi:polymer-forming cytoskeletal protein [Lacibacterium aquatile]|uniref:Polymer-forming cytoskeletal protein n=1 Tax=Lacibacterium aquatile TaxID=1168082 RepID=A0ABW5E1P7_9PROT